MTSLCIGTYAVRQSFCLCSHGVQLCGRRLLVGPASSSGLVSIVTDDNHSGADKVDDGEDDEVNKVHHEL